MIAAEFPVPWNVLVKGEANWYTFDWSKAVGAGTSTMAAELAVAMSVPEAKETKTVSVV